MERGIYPERLISHVKIGMILIGSKPKQEDPGLFLIRFMPSDPGSLVVRDVRVGSLFSSSSSPQPTILAKLT